MYEILARAGCFFAIIVMGHVLRRIGFFQKSDFKVLSKIVMKITLPAAIVSSFAGKTIDLTMLIVILIGLGVGAIHMILAILLSVKKEKGQRAFEIVNGSGLNIGSFSLPFVQSFFGPMGVITTSLFDIGNACVCLGGSYSVARMIKNGEKFSVTVLLRSLFKSIAFDCYIIAMILNLAGISLPGPAMTLVEIIGNANVFMAMLMVGVGFELSGDIQKIKDIGRMVAVRILVGILFAALFFSCPPLPLEARQALALLPFAPIPSPAPAYTEDLKEDVGLASAANSVSILCGIVFTVAATLLVS